ncbi:hypothetical protein ABPG74_013689 [Tetrahymena malaccensis]
MFMVQKVDQKQLKNELAQVKSNNNFSIQMFLDIVNLLSPQQQSHILDDNQNEIEYTTKYLFTYQQIESSSDQSNKNEMNQNQSKSKASYPIKNSNIMKNILKSFQRYIENEQDEQQKQHFCNLSKVSYGHTQLCKFLKFSLKTEGKRWNMKAKNLIERSKLKPLFEYYLININKFWLNNSKVSNKNEHEVLANYLLNQIQNPSDSSQIRFYQKNKQIIKSKI